MKKVVDFLENNVQWFTLGLGVAFVLWMAWTYVLQSPVSVQIADQKLAPKDVDKFIVNGVGSELEGKMRDGRVPRMNAPVWVEAFRDEMSYKDRVAGNFRTGFWPVNRTQEVTFTDTPIMAAPREVYVEKLPTPPVAIVEDNRSGNSNVAPLVALAAAEAPAAEGNADAQPVADQQTGKDVVWVTQKFRLSMVQLASALREKNVPVDQFKTTAFEVLMERQEILPDGSYGQVVPIPPKTVKLLPIPDAKATAAVKTAFVQWANAHVVDILQPAFYTVLLGDPWSPPGQAPPVTAPVEEQKPEEAFDPSKYVDATHDELMKLTPEQRRAVAAYKAKKEKEERESRSKGSRGGKGGLGGPGGGGGGSGKGGLGPEDGGRGATGGSQEGGGFIDPGSFQGGAQQGLERGQEERPPQDPAPQPGDFAGQFPLPAGGEFDPRETPDIVGWAHDDTVEPGKTYRYRITYRIKSPVWNTQNVCKPQELANTFFLSSEPSEWGPPISVPSLTSFFVIRPAFKGDGATIEVFRWAAGALQKKSFDVVPGDAVGMPDNGVDFGTGWTMVDMRTNPSRDGQRIVVLMDPSGRIHMRDFDTDRNSPEYKDKLGKVAGTPAASAGPAGDAMAGSR
jgi:hypothetical protein